MIGKTRQEPDQPRGILVPRFEVGQFSHQRQAPCAALAGLVEHYWHVAWDMQGHPPQAQETLPHPSVHLVVEKDGDGVFGVHTARYSRMLEGQGFAFGIKFRPGGFQPFLRAPLATIADRRVTPDSVFGEAGTAYVARIRACASADAMMPAAAAFLLERLPPPDANTDLANRLVATIAADASMTTVDALVAASGLNKRALQRLFQHYVGVGPKWVIKRYRMHEAVAQLQSDAPPRLAQLALDLGYFDQAHFINDFTALVGKPPGEYARQLTAPA
ncbi:helix-turn-helix domain-containing protein [Pseudoduganella violacea]|uniref:AraC-like DNA-binding protein n=1 Tax=Pseudoduganella violacea TaxID=1715466 RepID=A0A7W5BFF9_9BURK|nr:helix-turn-helix domain-containing protein [Pseudoduganella violacea]MBB3122132.1 AraC-like DNA-binding protein [Pseudoduganella violacea]